MTARHAQALVFRLSVGALVLACLVAATPTRAAENALSLRVTPLVAAAPATVSITVTVEPNERNRVLVIEDDADVYYRSSQVQLEGKNAARTHRLLFHGLPPGEHRVRASVHGTNGFVGVVSTTVMVVGTVE